jgi:hypothetical protein
LLPVLRGKRKGKRERKRKGIDKMRIYSYHQTNHNHTYNYNHNHHSSPPPPPAWPMLLENLTTAADSGLPSEPGAVLTDFDIIMASREGRDEDTVIVRDNFLLFAPPCGVLFPLLVCAVRGGGIACGRVHWLTLVAWL